MTMHLAQGLTTIKTGKSKKRNITKAKMAQWQEELRLHNKQMKRLGMHERRMTIDEYVEYIHGNLPDRITKQTKYSDPTEMKTLRPATQPYRRETPEYASKAVSSMSGYAAKAEPKQYTGTLIKGIATMHKSNAVPVIDKEQAEEISRMRRG